MGKRGWSIVILIIILVFIGFYVYSRLEALGMFDMITPRLIGDCTTVKGIPGPEDLQADHEKGFIYISSNDRPAIRSGKPLRGGIYRLNLNNPDYKPELMNPELPEVFFPHGLSLYSGEKKRLFVINHRSKEDHSVEIFEINNSGLLKHLKTIRNDLMYSPNDILAVGPESFYITNDRKSRSSFSRVIDAFFKLKRGSVAYYDNGKMRIIVEGMAYANGINMNKEGELVYVTETLGGKLNVFRRDLGDGNLTILHSFELGAGLDNIDIDEQGDLWIAVQPDLVALGAHMKDPSSLSPTKVLQISVNGEDLIVNEVFRDDGNLVSGGSVAVQYKSRLLLGAVSNAKIVICENDL